VWVTAETLAAGDLLLPFDDGRNEVGWVDVLRCGCHCPTGKHDGDRDDHHDEHDHGDGEHDHGVHDHGDHHHGDHDDEDVERTPPPRSAAAVAGHAMPGGGEPLDVCAAREEGMWELLPCDSQVLAVHAALMHTGKVLFFAGSGNNVPRFDARDVHSVVWDYEHRHVPHAGRCASTCSAPARHCWLTARSLSAVAPNSTTRSSGPTLPTSSTRTSRSGCGSVT
jgi:hypothetical protein